MIRNGITPEINSNGLLIGVLHTAELTYSIPTQNSAPMPTVATNVKVIMSPNEACFGLIAKEIIVSRIPRIKKVQPSLEYDGGMFFNFRVSIISGAFIFRLMPPCVQISGAHGCTILSPSVHRAGSVLHMKALFLGTRL